MLETSGYLMAVLMGLCLGLLGSGGSILTVPVLVYLFRLNPVTGTAYSLFVVGVTSLAGLLIRGREGLPHLRSALAFAVPSLTGVYLVRGHVIHSLPDLLPLPGPYAVARDTFIMALFAAVMAFAGLAMLRGGVRPPRPHSHAAEEHPSLLRIGAAGLAAGGLTGFVGAGGGFLIVPTLVLLAGLPMQGAVAASLAIISAQSMAGFAADWGLMEGIDWGFLGAFSALSIAGALAGAALGRRFDGARLRAAFGLFLILLAALILAKEFFYGGPA
jgi:uncharacterized membrane protein YfcA